MCVYGRNPDCSVKMHYTVCNEKYVFFSLHVVQILVWILHCGRFKALVFDRVLSVIKCWLISDHLERVLLCKMHFIAKLVLSLSRTTREGILLPRVL